MLAELEGAEKLSFNFRMEQAYLDVLDQWAEARGIKTRTAALKAMILELGDSWDEPNSVRKMVEILWER